MLERLCKVICMASLVLIDISQLTIHAEIMSACWAWEFWEFCRSCYTQNIYLNHSFLQLNPLRGSMVFDDCVHGFATHGYSHLTTSWLAHSHARSRNSTLPRRKTNSSSLHYCSWPLKGSNMNSPVWNAGCESNWCWNPDRIQYISNRYISRSNTFDKCILKNLICIGI